MASALADQVLPLIRTQQDLSYYRDAEDHGDQMHEAVDILEAAMRTADPVDVHTVIHQALTSAITLIPTADDSSGIIGDAIRRLLALHPKTAAKAQVPPLKLADWMYRFQFENEVDVPEIDPVAYAPTLGERGITAYRAKVEALLAEAGPAPEAFDTEDPYWSVRWALGWNERRLAVLAKDIDEIIRTHALDKASGADCLATAKALAEIYENHDAVEWAEEAIELGPESVAIEANQIVFAAFVIDNPYNADDLQLDFFRRWPSAATADLLYRTTDRDRPYFTGEVIGTLSARPVEAVTFALTTLRDPRLAWDLARSLDLQHDRLWSEVAAEYEAIDAPATLPVHRRLVEAALTNADPYQYERAAKRLKHMRKLAARTEQAAAVDQLIAELRETYRRRPRLLQEFNNARLP